ncbi:ComEC/Rec2 family competence protein [Candidatus Shapirobacteria bacterium]|nr:ComEC/Rec2 family competence protein [Candidatus Shapirobacteria bacterium]
MKLPFISLSLLLLGFYLFRLSQLPPIKIPEGQTVKIRGKITAQPYLKASYQIIEINSLVILTNRFPGYFYGDLIEVSGKFEKKVINRFQVQYVAFFPTIRLLEGKESLIEKTDWQKFLLKTRGQAEERVKRFLPEPQASLLLGIVLGVKSQMPEEFFNRLRKTGTLHLVVASGQNVALLSGFLINTLVYFLKRRWAICLTLFFVFLYVLMVGAEPPAVRAGLMLSLAFLAQLLGKQGDPVKFLFLSAVLMLIINPLILFDIGFQLSFAATTGIIVVYPRLKNLSWRLFKVPFLGEGLAVSFSAQACTLPILLINFGQFSWLSPLINALVLPLIPIIMAFGFIIIVLSFLITPLAQLLAWLVLPLLTYFVKVIDFFGHFDWISLTI